MILSPEHCDPAGLPAEHKIECNLLSHFQCSLTRNVCPDCSEPRVVVLGIRMEPYCDTSAAAAADEGSWDGKTLTAICGRSSTAVLLAEGSIGNLNIV